jgi:metal-sulfur cluster biosynthetic enzyme
MSDEPVKKVTWQAESTHPDLIEPLKDALRTIVDPEIGLNVIELGLIRDVLIEDQSADLTMILTTPFCPYGPAMIETTRQKAEEALGRTTHVQMGMEMWDFSMMEEGAAPDWGLY